MIADAAAIQNMACTLRGLEFGYFDPKPIAKLFHLIKEIRLAGGSRI